MSLTIQNQVTTVDYTSDISTSDVITALLTSSTSYYLDTNMSLAENVSFGGNITDVTASTNTIFETSSGNSLNNTSPPPSAPWRTYDRDSFRWASFSMKGVAIILGLICNILSFVVFCFSRMRKTTPGHYLLALSVYDTTCLVGEFLTWLNSDIGYTYRPILNLKFWNENEFACRFVMFLRYLGRFSSAWTTVFITAERFITVNYPLKVATISTTTVARTVLAVLTLVSLGLCSFPFYTLHLRKLANSDETICRVNGNVRELYTVFMWLVVYVGDFILPSILVIVLTIMILVTLSTARATRKKQAEGQKVRSDREAQLTLTLVGVALAFIILRLPYIFAHFLWTYMESVFPMPLTEYTVFSVWAAREICEVFSVMNYSINFFLYAMCGSAFRSEFRRVFCCVKTAAIKRSKTGMTSINGSSMYMSGGSTRAGHSVRNDSESGKI